MLDACHFIIFYILMLNISLLLFIYPCYFILSYLFTAAILSTVILFCKCLSRTHKMCLSVVVVVVAYAGKMYCSLL